MRKKAQEVPVVVYHSVADEEHHFLRNLTLPVELFERQLRYLDGSGFHSVTLHDVYAYLELGAPLPPKAVALTLDDGYLDNWVYVFPLLKKYGMKATIFVITDFIDPREHCRPNLEDVWSGRVSQNELERWGHLSWLELERMEASGLVDIQSHTKTHSWYYVSDHIVDFHHPSDDYHWLFWNAHPNEKYDWLALDFREWVAWGTPVYEFGQTLLQRRYFEDAGLSDAVTEHVANHGGKKLFDKSGWKRELEEVVERYRAENGSYGRYESEDEYWERIRSELIDSKTLLEERLHKEVDFLCWPCGDYSEKLQRFAIDECGYLATANVSKTTNRFGDDPREVRRIVFGTDYDGPLQSDLIYLNFLGAVNYASGIRLAYPIAPISRRLMRFCKFLERLGGR